MEENLKKTNKATLIAAVLIIAGATAIFGTYAAENDVRPSGPGPFTCFEQMNKLSDEDKAKMQEIHEKMQAGDIGGARAIMEELGFGFRGPGPRLPHMATEEQKAAMEKARELFQTGDQEGAKAIMEEWKPERKMNKGGFKKFSRWEKTDE